ncbi:rhodanese-like domain-containing protein [Mameliella alba]|uniref:rhodanese-like domain-containing protein n=1 Tax=Mameliella alba TaxID=561184 RepID=UPI000B52BB8B|nr:rhodanese-like domain-containing protein [Mameliella alba]MBY6121148.1 PQQ-dependent catabolism-associated CXXCW motif protein [Mameliella alba]OWV41549.1 sulfurtransferase [Mameliella alba]OWV61545.1 sulfurtransferase [Mameliella alba]
MKRLFFLLVLICAAPLAAAPYAEHQARRPELFDPETGYRIGRQRAPTPDDIPAPAVLVTPQEARALLAEGALALDVFAAQQSRFDELEGTWLVSEQRLSLPGAVWLPEVGRGRLSDIMQRYLEDNLARMTAGDRARALLVYCVADCWMSWNAAQRIADLGYSRVYWFRLGTDGWLDIGGTLEPVDPVAVDVD